MIYRRKGVETLVSTAALPSGDRIQPQITQLASGGFVLFWLDRQFNGPTETVTGRAQIFDAAGQPLGSSFVAYAESAAPLPGGGFVTVWSAGSVHLQRWDSTGAKVAAEVVVDTPATFLYGDAQPKVTVLASGAMVVTWAEPVPVGPNSFQLDVHAQILDSAGAKVGAEFLVHPTTPGNESEADVVALQSGGFVVTWDDNGIVRGQVYDSSGTKAGAAFVVSSGYGPWIEPHVAALSTGGFVVVWDKNTSSGGYVSIDDIHAQIFDAAGNEVGSDFIVKEGQPGQVSSLDVAGLADGGFVVTWADDSHDGADQDLTSIRARAYDGAGNAFGAEIEVNTQTSGYQIQPVVAVLADGDVVVGWADWPFAGSGGPPNIKMQFLEVAGPVSGTATGETLQGTANNDELLGLGGDDELIGGAGGDRLDGGSGQDVLRGGDGNDILVVKDVSTDILEGGSGTDTLILDYNAAGTSILTDSPPSSNAAQGGYDGVFHTPDGQRVDFTSIERFEITGAPGDDVIVTGGGDDILAGGGGNDRLEGGAGRDLFIFWGIGTSTVIGGAGSDTLRVAWGALSSPVTLALGTSSSDGFAGSVDGGPGLRIDFTGIDSFDLTTGSGDDIVRTGSEFSRVVLGAGNDQLVSGGVNDSADGGAGVDGLSVDMSGFIANISWNLASGLLVAPTGAAYGGFEYFISLRTGFGFDFVGTTADALDDLIYLGGGSDSVTVVNGHDIVDGEAGTDRLTINYSAATAAIASPGGAAWLSAATSGSGFKGQLTDGGTRTVDFDNFETFSIQTGSGNDDIWGGANGDTLSTGAGSDMLHGAGGADTLDGGAGDDSMFGGAGNDVYLVDSAGDSVTEVAGEGTDTVRTAIGSSAALYVLPANVENLTGTSALGQTVAGNALDNVVTMGTGNDVIDLSAGGNDTANGGLGNDFFFFGAALTAADSAIGGLGTDAVALLGTYNLTLGAGTLNGIETLNLLSGSTLGGSDRFGYSIVTNDANVPAGGQLTVFAGGLLADETLLFNASAETDAVLSAIGGAGNDIFAGGPANDTFVGGGGNDLLVGLGGNDWLQGDGGADTLRGGFGSDLFVYKSASDSPTGGMDHILDFEDTTDLISLQAIDADVNAGGDQAFTFIGADAFHGTAGELRVYQSGADFVVEGDTNGDGSADFAIQVTTVTGYGLDAPDFML